MTRPFADYDGFELWFLTGSQGLYGEETLRQVAAQSQQVVATRKYREKRLVPAWPNRC